MHSLHGCLNRRVGSTCRQSTTVGNVVNCRTKSPHQCSGDENILKSYKESCSPKDHLMPEWDVLAVLKGLSAVPFEPLDKASFRDLSIKTVFLLAPALSKRVSEIHALSREVRHSDKNEHRSLSPQCQNSRSLKG